MLRKKPPIAQVLVSDAFFRYFVVLSENEDVTSLLGLKMDRLLLNYMWSVTAGVKSWIFRGGRKVVKGPHLLLSTRLKSPDSYRAHLA